MRVHYEGKEYFLSGLSDLNRVRQEGVEGVLPCISPCSTGLAIPGRFSVFFPSLGEAIEWVQGLGQSGIGTRELTGVGVFVGSEVPNPVLRIPKRRNGSVWSILEWYSRCLGIDVGEEDGFS